MQSILLRSIYEAYDGFRQSWNHSPIGSSPPRGELPENIKEDFLRCAAPDAEDDATEKVFTKYQSILLSFYHNLLYPQTFYTTGTLDATQVPAFWREGMWLKGLPFHFAFCTHIYNPNPAKEKGKIHVTFECHPRHAKILNDIKDVYPYEPERHWILSTEKDTWWRIVKIHSDHFDSHEDGEEEKEEEEEEEEEEKKEEKEEEDDDDEVQRIENPPPTQSALSPPPPPVAALVPANQQNSLPPYDPDEAQREHIEQMKQALRITGRFITTTVMGGGKTPMTVILASELAEEINSDMLIKNLTEKQLQDPKQNDPTAYLPYMFIICEEVTVNKWLDALVRQGFPENKIIRIVWSQVAATRPETTTQKFAGNDIREWLDVKEISAAEAEEEDDFIEHDIFDEEVFRKKKQPKKYVFTPTKKFLTRAQDKPGMWLVIDECHKAKNASNQGQAVASLVDGLFSMNGKALKITDDAFWAAEALPDFTTVTGGCRSRVLGLSATLFETPAHCLNIAKTLGLFPPTFRGFGKDTDNNRIEKQFDNFHKLAKQVAARVYNWASRVRPDRYLLEDGTQNIPALRVLADKASSVVNLMPDLREFDDGELMHPSIWKYKESGLPYPDQQRLINGDEYLFDDLVCERTTKRDDREQYCIYIVFVGVLQHLMMGGLRSKPNSTIKRDYKIIELDFGTNSKDKEAHMMLLQEMADLKKYGSARQVYERRVKSGASSALYYPKKLKTRLERLLATYEHLETIDHVSEDTTAAQIRKIRDTRLVQIQINKINVSVRYIKECLTKEPYGKLLISVETRKMLYQLVDELRNAFAENDDVELTKLPPMPADYESIQDDINAAEAIKRDADGKEVKTRAKRGSAKASAENRGGGGTKWYDVVNHDPNSPVRVIFGDVKKPERETLRKKFQEQNNDVRIIVGMQSIVCAGADYHDEFDPNKPNDEMRPRFNFMYPSDRTNDQQQQLGRTERHGTKPGSTITARLLMAGGGDEGDVESEHRIMQRRMAKSRVMRSGLEDQVESGVLFVADFPTEVEDRQTSTIKDVITKPMVLIVQFRWVTVPPTHDEYYFYSTGDVEQMKKQLKQKKPGTYNDSSFVTITINVQPNQLMRCTRQVYRLVRKAIGDLGVGGVLIQTIVFAVASKDPDSISHLLSDAFAPPSTDMDEEAPIGPPVRTSSTSSTSSNSSENQTLKAWLTRTSSTSSEDRPITATAKKKPDAAAAAAVAPKGSRPQPPSSESESEADPEGINAKQPMMTALMNRSLVTTASRVVVPFSYGLLTHIKHYSSDRGEDEQSFLRYPLLSNENPMHLAHLKPYASTNEEPLYASVAIGPDNVTK
jgi:hypothetical protein